jgi:hypothetical protein
MTLALTTTALWSFPALAGVGLGAAGRRAALAPAATLAACVVLIALAWPWLRLLPGYSMARHPLAWSWLAPFFIAWLVALGTDASRATRRQPAAASACSSRSSRARWSSRRSCRS